MVTAGLNGPLGKTAGLYVPYYPTRYMYKLYIRAIRDYLWLLLQVGKYVVIYVVRAIYSKLYLYFEVPDPNIQSANCYFPDLDFEVKTGYKVHTLFTHLAGFTGFSIFIASLKNATVELSMKNDANLSKRYFGLDI